MSGLSKGEQEFVSDFGPLAENGAGPGTGASAAAASPGPRARELDARGIPAPLPLLRAHRALRALPVGQLLRVTTSQPDSPAEFQALAAALPGCELVGQEQAADAWVHLLRRRR